MALALIVAFFFSTRGLWKKKTTLTYVSTVGLRRRRAHSAGAARKRALRFFDQRSLTSKGRVGSSTVAGGIKSSSKKKRNSMSP